MSNARNTKPKQALKRSGKQASGTGSKSPKASRKPKSPDIDALVEKVEIMAAICQWFSEGLGAAAIARKVVKTFPGTHMTREMTYPILQKAGYRGWLQFCPPPHAELRAKLKDSYPQIGDIEVVNTSMVVDVANTAARELLHLIRKQGRKIVHVGFAGGHSMRQLAGALARLLCEPHRGLPETIWFHALATGFDPEDPTTNPNAFFTYFVNEPVIGVRLRFHGLNAPSMIRPRNLAGLKKLQEIREAFEAAKKLDIVVTSGSLWRDPDCTLHKRMTESEKSLEILNKANCIGDILWRPIGPDGPIEIATELRALTLVDLGQLQKSIQSTRQRVLLMLAPCGICHAPKGDLLAAVLDQEQPLITDLVVDSYTARQMLNRLSPDTQ